MRKKKRKNKLSVACKSMGKSEVRSEQNKDGKEAKVSLRYRQAWTDVKLLDHEISVVRWHEHVREYSIQPKKKNINRGNSPKPGS